MFPLALGEQGLGGITRVRCLVYTVVACCIAPCASAASPDAEFFEKKIRPVLAEHCYSCHGPEKQKSELRLDHGAFIQQGGEAGPLLDLAKPEAGRLAVAIAYTDVDLQMPPKGKLPEAQIADLMTWIAQGAPWPDEPVPGDGTTAAKPEPFNVRALRDKHWAWQPIQNPAAPEVADAAWPRDDIDRFVLARLEQEGLPHNAEADRRTLYRRLSFDLTGLPPAPEEVEAFVADDSPDAYERAVDRMLASPHFGERWGRHWLDLTRYAETYGHEGDYPVEHAWRYRDYVIRAFNADVPYDQMLREHIAGDLLQAPRVDAMTGMNESIAATGFWYMHQATHAPVDVRLDQADRIDNQIDVFSKAFLGVTVSCARCHDHKFDAVSMKDYYALAGFLRSSRQQFAYVDPHGQIGSGLEKVKRETVRLARAIQDSFGQPPAKPVSPYMLAAADVTGGASVWSAVEAHGVSRKALDKWLELVDNAEAFKDPQHPLHLWWRAARENPTREWFDEIAAWLREQQAQPAVAPAEVVYETFDSPEAFSKWQVFGDAFGNGPTGAQAWAESKGDLMVVPPGVVHSGLIDDKLEGTVRSPDFVLEHDSILWRAAGRGEVRIIIEGYELRDYNPLLFENTFLTVKQGDEFKWVQQVGGLSKFKGRTAFLEIVDTGAGWIAVDEIRFSDEKPRPAADYGALAALLGDTPPDSLDALARRYDEQVRLAMQAWANGDAKPWQYALLNALSARRLWSPVEGNTLYARSLERKDRAVDALPKYERVLAMSEGTPQDEVVHLRGSYKTPGDRVPRRFLEAVAGPEETPIREGSGRLELAERMLDERNPLTARVMANRIWHHLLGRGIVPSTDNFGVLGQPPSHPELLDHLATRFKGNGWSIKGLIRDVVLTSTYRMSSEHAAPEVEAKDPANVLLHRMNRRRLEGEAVRDAIFATAGTLDRTLFGQSIPAYISPFFEGNRRPEQSGPADGARRRSIYMEVRRNYLPPMLQAFDMPVPDTTQGKRNVSNVPAQALILMNDPVIVEQAQAWGKAVVSQPGSAAARIDALYRRALARPATQEEIARMEAFVAQQGTLYALSPEAALEDERIWADLCHVMFTLKEFIFIG
jgi:hypothetical protein